MITPEEMVNGQLDPGESAIITIPAINAGHSDCSIAEFELVSSSPYITINPELY